MVKNLLYFIPLGLLFIGCKKNSSPPEPEILETDPVLLVKVKRPVNAAFAGYYAGIPVHYNETTRKYPLLIGLHGLGQRGEGNRQLDLLADAGLGRLLALRKLPPNFVVNGRNFSFIYICPQFGGATPTPEQVLNLIDTIKNKYRIDLSRIYLTGLSVGGVITTETASKFPRTFAAIAPLAGVSNMDVIIKCRSMAKARLAVWAFHNDKDPTIPSFDSKYLVSTINSFAPVIPARLSLFTDPFGHDAWTQALDPAYKEEGKNLYEWMLQYAR
jgi:predicted peptidase